MSNEVRIPLDFSGLKLNVGQACRRDFENAHYNTEVSWFEQARQIADSYGYRIDFDTESDDWMGDFVVIGVRDNWDAEAELNFIADIEAHGRSVELMFNAALAKEIAR